MDPLFLLLNLMKDKKLNVEFKNLPSETDAKSLIKYNIQVIAGPITTVGDGFSLKNARQKASNNALSLLVQHGILTAAEATDKIPEEYKFTSNSKTLQHNEQMEIESSCQNKTEESTTNILKCKRPPEAMMDMYRNIRNKKRIHNNDNYTQPLPEIKVHKYSKYPETFKQILDKNNVTIEQIMSKIQNEDVTEFVDILRTLNLKYNIMYAEAGNSRVTALLSINTNPKFVNTHMAQTKEEAFQGAIKETFKFLKIMCS